MLYNCLSTINLAAPRLLQQPLVIYLASISEIQLGLKGLRVESSRSNKSDLSPLGFFKYQVIIYSI